MIVNIKSKKRFKFLYRYLFQVIQVFSNFTRYSIINKLFEDSTRLKNFYQTNYPKLTTDFSGIIKCVSCMLCEKACPTDAIKIEAKKMMNMNESLFQGKCLLSFV